MAVEPKASINAAAQIDCSILWIFSSSISDFSATSSFQDSQSSASVLHREAQLSNSMKFHLKSGTFSAFVTVRPLDRYFPITRSEIGRRSFTTRLRYRGFYHCATWYTGGSMLIFLLFVFFIIT